MNNHIKALVFLTLLAIADSTVAVAQTGKLDSLLNKAASAKDDTNKVMLYETIGNAYFAVGNTEDAKHYYLKQKDLSEKLNYLPGIFYSTCNCSGMFLWTGQYDSTVILYEIIAPKIEASGNKDLIAKLKYQLGIAHNAMGHYEISMDYYLQALHICEETNNEDGIGKINGVLAESYLQLKLYDKAIAAAEKAISSLSMDTNSPYYLQTLMQLGEVYMHAGYLDKAEEIFLKSIGMCNKEAEITLRSIALLSLGNIYFDKKEYEKAKKYTIESLEVLTMVNYTLGITEATLLLGKIEFQQKNFAKAEEYALQTLEICKKDNIYDNMYNSYTLLSDIDIVKGDFQAMLQKRHLADSILDIVTNDKMRKTTEELSIKYETEKKELKIASLEKEKKLYTAVIIIAIITLLLAVFLFIYRQRLQKNKIKQLEQEKQLIATQSVLDGETAERFRISRDLHDGLGSMLSVIRMNLNSFKKDIQTIQNKVDCLDQTVILLDNSIEEMRRVAHHLMPDALNRFGLKTALTDFLNTIPLVEFNYYGSKERIDNKLEVVVYRIIHELVTNSLKYASASKILVQLIIENNRISFTVEDNGCGFDTETVTYGMGIANIRNRVASFGGTIDFRPQQGKGTEVNVELKIS